jgi:hypothetical protein
MARGRPTLRTSPTRRNAREPTLTRRWREPHPLPGRARRTSPQCSSRAAERRGSRGPNPTQRAARTMSSLISAFRRDGFINPSRLPHWETRHEGTSSHGSYRTPLGLGGSGGRSGGASSRRTGRGRGDDEVGGTRMPTAQTLAHASQGASATAHSTPRLDLRIQYSTIRRPRPPPAQPSEAASRSRQWGLPRTLRHIK